MSTCTVISCAVGKGCCLWPVCSLDKTLLALPCFILYCKAKLNLLLLSISWLLTFAFQSLMMKKDIFFLAFVLEGLVGLHRTIQIQLLQHRWLGHRLGLLLCWMVCLGNESRSLCHFWDCIQVLHFGPLCFCVGNSISFKGFLPTVVDIMAIWIKFAHSHTF